MEFPCTKHLLDQQFPITCGSYRSPLGWKWNPLLIVKIELIHGTVLYVKVVTVTSHYNLRLPAEAWFYWAAWGWGEIDIACSWSRSGWVSESYTRCIADADASTEDCSTTTDSIDEACRRHKHWRTTEVAGFDRPSFPLCEMGFRSRCSYEKGRES